MRSLGYLVALAIICTGCELKHEPPVREVEKGKYVQIAFDMQKKYRRACEALVHLGCETDESLSASIGCGSAMAELSGNEGNSNYIQALQNESVNSHKRIFKEIGIILDAHGDVAQISPALQRAIFLVRNCGGYLKDPAHPELMSEFKRTVYKNIPISDSVMRIDLALGDVAPRAGETPYEFAWRLRAQMATYTKKQTKSEENEMRAIWRMQLIPNP
jgi:hypothetical protein